MNTDRLTPARDDDTWGFFAAAADGRLVVGVCSICDAVLHLPRPYCHFCGSFEVGWRIVQGSGRLWTWTTVHQPVHPGLATPYTVVVVELDEPSGVRYVGHLPGVPELTIGMPMTVRFDQVGEDVVIPQWIPAVDG